MLKDKKKPSFLMNVVLIVFAQIAVKLLGAVYRMVITNVDGFGDMGNGYYNYGFQIYTLLLSISSIGIPNAISKLVAERCALDDFKGAMRIFRVALVLFACVGAAFAAIMYFCAGFIATVILDTPLAKYTIMALSPAILFVSVTSVIRGFFAGQQNMHATNTSQVLEQVIKCTSTITIVLAMVGSKPEFMAAGATCSTSVATLLSLIYLFGFYRMHKKELSAKEREAPSIKLKGNARRIARTILLVSIPISLGSVVASLNRVIDIMTVVRGVKTALSGVISDPEKLTDEAVRLSGILSKTDVLINLPLALNTAFATVLVPTIAGALAVKDMETAKEKVSMSLLISTVVALPCTIGYMVLSTPILKLIYPNASDGGVLFMMVAPTVFFAAISQTIYGSLQGMGKIFIPALSVLCGGIAKLILNLILIPIPSINIYGAPIGSIACQAIAFTVSFSVLRKNLPVKLGLVKYFLKPFFAAMVMGGIVWTVNHFLTPFIGRYAAIAAIVAGGCVYLALVIGMKIVTLQDLGGILRRKKKA